MIIQGTNVPLEFSFASSMEQIQDIEIHLYDKQKQEIKHWSIEDVTIENEKVIVPIEQKESINFPVGDCHFEIKWLDVDGKTNFAKSLCTTIIERIDKTLMQER
jgi:hypothetical protein